MILVSSAALHVTVVKFQIRNVSHSKILLSENPNLIPKIERLLSQRRSVVKTMGKQYANPNSHDLLIILIFYDNSVINLQYFNRF